MKNEREEEDGHPCFDCAESGEGGAFMDFPHALRIKCSVDGHNTVHVLDLRHSLDSLYEKCPLKEKGDGV